VILFCNRITTVNYIKDLFDNSDLFDKGSGNISKLEFRTAPVASTPVVNSSIVTRWYIRSNSVSAGGTNYDTEVYFFTSTILGRK
jgi:hypothetical protein